MSLKKRSSVKSSLAPFNKEIKSIVTMVHRGTYSAEISETYSLFNWEPIDLEETLIDMCNFLQKNVLV